MSRARIAIASVCVMSGLGLIGRPARAQERAYRSPYHVEFTRPLAELVDDLEGTERGDRWLESEIPYHEWYSRRTLVRWQAWGPTARHYPAPSGLEHWSVERKRERVVAVAIRFLGHGYRHHHIPDWDPPAFWPWKPTDAGSNGRGVDCSNLTGFVYNLGFGLRLSTDVHLQAQGRVARGSVAGHEMRVDPVALPPTFEDRIRTLRTGDLVFIRNRGGGIVHVVIWVGSIGRSPDGVPLVIDSHGVRVRDFDGRPIPSGVQLRPFREDSWYNRGASHALRIFPD